MKTRRILSAARLSLPFASALVALLAPQFTHAGQIWDGGGADNNWNTAVNWDSNTLPTFTSAITFRGNTRNTPSNNLAADSIIGGITFGNTGATNLTNAFTLSGNRITLGGNITTTANTGGATISNTISQNMILNGNRTITTNQLSATVQHNLTISGIISETGGVRNLAKTGAGTLTLSGANTYSGTTTIGTNASNVGTVNITNGSALGTGAVSIVSNAGNGFLAALTLNSTTGITVANNFTTSGEGQGGNGIIRNVTGNNLMSGTFTLGAGGGSTRIHSDGGSLTLSGNFAPSSTGRVLFLGGSATGTVSGNINNGSGANTLSGLTKEGTGTWTLSGANTFSGNITVNEGTLVGGGATNSPGVSVFGSRVNTRTITVNDGGTLQFNSGNILGSSHTDTTAPTLIINSGGIVTNGGIATNNALNNVQINGGTLTSTTGHTSSTPPNTPVYGAWNLNGTVTSTGNSTISTSDPSKGWVMLKVVGDKTTDFSVTSGTLTVSAPLVDNPTDSNIGSLTKSGAGAMILSGTNTYSGATLVSDGNLTLSGTGSVNSSSGITISGANAKLLQSSSVASTPTVTLTQGTLTGSGTVGNVNVGAGTGAVISNNDGVAGASLTIGTLTFSGAATINTFGNSISAPIVTTNLVSNSFGTVTINPTAASWANGSTYDLISYTGGSIGGDGFSPFALGTVAGLTARQSAILGNSASAITLVIGGDAPKWTGIDNSNWQTGTTGAGENWKLVTAGTATPFLTTDDVLFDDSATGTTTVDISAANVSPFATTFNNSSQNYALGSTGGFGITSGSLAKNGTGILTITNANTYTGATTINGGTLQLGDGGSGGALSASSAISVATGATFAVNQSDTVTQGTDFSSAAITGAGGFTQAGGGTTILNVANTYTGTTAINGGTLQLGTAGALTGTTGITSSGTATLAINRSNAFAQATDLNGQAITGAGLSLTQAGTGTTTLSLANSYGGLTTINGGIIRITDVAALGGTTNGVVVNGTNSGAATNARLELSGGITVTGESATISGNGNFLGALQSQSGANEWAGNVTVDADLTRIGAANGASLLVSGVIDDGINDYRLMYRVGDSAASVTLTGANTYTGPTSIVGIGPVIIGSLNSVAGGTASSHLGAPTNEANGRITIGTTTVSGFLRYTGNGETTDRTIQIGENNSGTPASGDTGSATFESSGATGALVFSAPNFNAPTNALTGTTPARTLTLGGTNANANTISGIIQNNQIAGSPTAAVNVTKTGDGSWTLAGANTYTGTTTINQGTLAFTTTSSSLAGGLTFGATSGSTSTGTLDLSGVASSATFAGAMLVQTNSTTANAITLAASKTLTLDGGLTLGNNVDGGESRLTMTGGGALVVNGASIIVGNNTAGTNASSEGHLNLAALGSFTATLTGSLTVQNQGDNSGGADSSSLTLSNGTNSITAAAVRVGNSSTGATQRLWLGGGTNLIQTDLINLGAGSRDTGVIDFAGSGGSVTLRNVAGTGRIANVNLGPQSAQNTAYTTANLIDFTGNTADVAIGTFATSLGAKVAANTNDLLFDTGTLDIRTINMAVAQGTGASTNRITIGGGTVRLGGSAAFSDAGTGVLTLATAGSGELIINGGTVTSTAALTKAVAGTGTAALTMNGGTLDMGGNNISNLTTITYTDGTLKNLGIVNTGMTLSGTGSRFIDQATGISGEVQGAVTGTGIGLDKQGVGKLTLSGTNTYDGPTVISAGTLFVTGSISSNVTVSDNATLGGDGTVGEISFAAGSNFDIALALSGNPLDSTSISFAAAAAGFGVDNLIANGSAVVWSSVGNGTYTLINGTLNSANLDHFGLANAFDLGGGRSAYFQSGSLQLVVVPEPSFALLTGLGAMLLLRRRRA